MSNNSLLPKFTFLTGPNTLPLASLIAGRDSSILIEDFQRPLREATLALFYHNDVLSTDLSQKRDNKDLLPFGNKAILDWLLDFENFIEKHLGEDALGQIALRDYIAQGWHDVFDRTLFRDTETPDYVKPFADHYGAEHCLVVNCGIATRPRAWPCRIIWLPIPDPPKQLEFLDHELEVAPCQTK